MLWTATIVTKSNVDSGGHAEYLYNIKDENNNLLFDHLMVTCFPSEVEDMIREQMVGLKKNYYENEEVEIGTQIVVNGDI